MCERTWLRYGAVGRVMVSFISPILAFRGAASCTSSNSVDQPPGVEISHASALFSAVRSLLELTCSWVRLIY